MLRLGQKSYASLFIILLTLSATVFTTSAKASAGTVMLYMENPSTKLPAASNEVQFILQKVNQMDGARTTVQGGENGITTLNLDTAFTYMVSPAVVSPRYTPGDFLIIKPRQDGTEEVLSSTGENVIQNSKGAWIVTFPEPRMKVTNDPWVVGTNRPPSGVGPLVLLSNGKILASAQTQDRIITWWLLSPNENGDYLNGTWSQAAQPPASFNPGGFNAMTLHSGNLLVTAGEANYDATIKKSGSFNQVFIYNVKENTWIQKASPVVSGLEKPFELSSNPTAELADGRVIGTTNLYQPPTMVYDEVNDSWTQAGNCCSNSESGFTLMQNDKVLHIDTTWNKPSKTQSFDPISGLWLESGYTTQPLSVSEIGPAISLMSGKVFATGATQFTGLYDPKNNSWETGPTFPKLKNGWIMGAADGELAVLPSGNVLINGGGFIFYESPLYMSYMPPAKYYLYNVKENSLTQIIDDPLAAGTTTWAPGISMVVLPNGQILVSHANKIAAYRDSGEPDNSWRPIVDSISTTSVTVGEKYSISGRQVSGLTQGTHFGDELQNPTNFPVIRVVNDKTGHVFYGLTSNISSTSIAPMVKASFDFTLGRAIENGNSKLYVIANGIPSAPQKIVITGGVALPPSTSIANTPATTIKAQNSTSAKSISCVKGQNVRVLAAGSKKCPSGYSLRK